MKRAIFYITATNENGQPDVKKKSGYIYDSGRSVYGIDNRGTAARPFWHVSEISTGYAVINRTFNTRAEAVQAITPELENRLIECLNSGKYDSAKKRIAEAYKNDPTAGAQKRPAGVGYIIEYYTTPGDVSCARFYPVKHPDIIEIETPAADVEAIKAEILKNTPRAYFEEINPASDQAQPENCEDSNEKTATEKNPVLYSYVFRIYTGWSVYDGIITQDTITARNDAEAREIAIKRAAGKAFSVNRAWNAKLDAATA